MLPGFAGVAMNIRLRERMSMGANQQRQKLNGSKFIKLAEWGMNHRKCLILQWTFP
jgi:hypothetical protein